MKSTLKIIILLLILLFTVSTTLFIFQKNKLKKEIMKHKIQYFPTVGWIDWGHAIPTGPKKLVDQIFQNNNDTIIYFQDMKKRIGDELVIVRLTNKYYVPNREHMNKKTKGGIARFILEDISADFENLQASYPYRPSCGIGIGDRNGDRIALLRALHISFNGKLGKSKDAKKAVGYFEKNKGENEKTPKILSKLLPPIVKVKRCGDSKIEHLVIHKVPPKK